jgi:hypothetical protein
MDFNVSGSVTPVNAHPSKAFALIVFNFFENVTSFKEEQPRNAAFPTDVILSDILYIFTERDTSEIITFVKRMTIDCCDTVRNNDIPHQRL